jgi:DNA-binding protein HU-beta
LESWRGRAALARPNLWIGRRAWRITRAARLSFGNERAEPLAFPAAKPPSQQRPPPVVITEPVANRRSRGYPGALIWENTMNNAELAETLVANHNLSKADARKVVDDLMAAIVAAAAKGEEVSLSGFGKFKIKDSPAREGRNPSNGETIQIAASKKLTFVPAKAVKDALNG